MYKLAFVSFTDQHLTAAGLILFMLFFSAVVVWVNLKSNKEFYDKVAQSPLNDGEAL